MARTLEYLARLLGGGNKKKKKKNMKQVQTVELKVRMDCDGCELKVRKALSSIKGKALSSIKGIDSVEINRKQQKVTVVGREEANKVLKKVKATGKKAEIWPYVPCNLVGYPYNAQAYDKKAPPGYVRNVAYSNTGNKEDETYTAMFSDENPNSCSIM